VTITGVDTARDLGSAKVFIRSSGTPDRHASALEGLNAAAPFLRTELGRVLHVRRVPELRFQSDRSYEHAQRIEQLLAEVIVPEESPEPDGESE
jgi:ribosome-binding factor A